MKKIILAVAVAALAIMAVASSASAGVERYQTQTATLKVIAAGGAYVHTYTITKNPCDSSFTGTGGIASLGLQENVSGTINGQNLTLTGEYLTYNTPYTYTYSGPLSGGTGHDTLGQSGPLTFELNVTSQSNFKNHGEYVSSQGGGSDAAHSCIGMPIH